MVARVAGCRLGFGGWLCLAAWLSRRVGEVPRTPAAPYRVIYRTDETSRIDYVLDIDYRPEFHRHRQR